MTRNTHSVLSLLLPIGIVAATAAGLGVSPTRACTTPVYRVAMYDWTAAPYHVFYFHRGPIPQAEEKVNQQIVASAKDKPPANIALRTVDLDQKKALDELPEAVREAWKREQKQGQPLYLVYTAWGAELFAGRLTADEAAKLVASPKRTRLAELLDEGNAAVFLVLDAPDKDKTQSAEKTIAGVLADATAGKIHTGLEQADPAAPVHAVPAAGEAQPGGVQAPKPQEIRVATLTVSRTDPAESWLVRALLAVEPDLKDYPNDPMVFPVYGRARALAPLVGKGITLSNLTDAVTFLAGACSCTIKDQNPGVDLLVRWDWARTAEALAASDPTLDWRDGQFGYREIEPDAAGRPVNPTVATPERAPDAASVRGTGGKGRVPAAAERTAPKAQPVAAADAGREDSATPGDTAADPSNRQEPADAYATRQIWRLAIGIGLGAIVILAASVALLRRQ